MPVKYELRCYGEFGGSVHYLVDGVEVTKNEYYTCWKENQNVNI
jgi:hypothetical protein